MFPDCDRNDEVPRTVSIATIKSVIIRGENLENVIVFVPLLFWERAAVSCFRGKFRARFIIKATVCGADERCGCSPTTQNTQHQHARQPLGLYSTQAHEVVVCLISFLWSQTQLGSFSQIPDRRLCCTSKQTLDAQTSSEICFIARRTPDLFLMHSTRANWSSAGFVKLSHQATLGTDLSCC